MEKLAFTGGDLTKELSSVCEYTNKEDELMVAICKDLLSNKHTSSDIVTVSMIENHFKKHKQNVYRKCFDKGDSYLMRGFGKSMYYLYYFIVMDRYTFEKKYAIPHVTKNDSVISKDIRLLNYIEESLKEGNIEECHLFATQLSDGMKGNMKEFIGMCESSLKYKITMQTIRDHSNNLLAANFELKK